MMDPNQTQMGTPPRLDPNRTVMGAPPTLNATQTIVPVQCPVCKTFNPVGVMFCTDCGLIFDRALPDDAFGAPAVQLPVLVDGTGREHPVRPGATVVGREGDIAVTDTRMSRRHAQIVSDAGALSIEDLGSTNGTVVDGKPLAAGEKLPLQGGESIAFGGVEFRLQLPGQTPGGATQAFASNRTVGIAAPPTKDAPAARLVGDDRAFGLRLGVNTFGRRQGNHIVLDNPYVSGRHGEIEVTEDGVFLTDLASTNGTLLNQARLAPNVRTPVTPEDVIRLGEQDFRILREP